MREKLDTPKEEPFRGYLLVRSRYELPICSPPINGGFYFRAFNGSVTFPVAGYNYGVIWVPPPAGLAPAGTSVSVAAARLGTRSPARPLKHDLRRASASSH
jgi:hypothetical protein